MAPLTLVMLQRHPGYRKTVSIAGFIVTLASMVGASFANNIAQLLGTQGILLGFGGSLLYFPVFIYVDEWFVKRRGLAYGVLIAGDGAGGVIIPLIMEWILNAWGFRTALRAWAIVLFVLTIPCLYFLKPRTPDNSNDQTSVGLDIRFLQSPAFWILQAGNMLQSLGYFMPLYYMPCE